jgi:hypothetical protein
MTSATDHWTALGCFRTLGFATLMVLATSLTPDRELAASRQAPCPAVGDTMSLLQPSDPGYADALEFGKFLENHHIGLRCITRTTIGSNFLGESKSAGFQTELGPISVVFFPMPDGAERVTTELTVSRGHYHYTFRTRQPGLANHEVMDTDAPFHFLIQGRWFIFVIDARAEEPLRLALAGGTDCPKTGAN